MSVFNTKYDLITAVLDYLAYARSDYYERAHGLDHLDYLEEQIALRARDYVAAVTLSENEPVGWNVSDSSDCESDPDEVFKEIRGY